MSDLEATLKDLPRLLREREEALDEREKKIQRLQESLEKEYPSLGKPSDVLKLNIGGTVRIHVLRRTLTHGLEGSLLESMFSGRWDDSLEKDEDGNFFIDQEEALFVTLVNYLRNRQNETPVTKRTSSPKLEQNFTNMCEYYGVTSYVYPCALYLFNLQTYMNDKSVIPQDFISDFHKEIREEAKETTTYFLQHVVGCHYRSLEAFEVVLDNCSHAVIGWVDKERLNENVDEDVGWNGNGFGPYSVALDCKQCGTVKYMEGSLTSLGSAAISLKPGTRIRAELIDKTVAWYADGKELFSETIAVVENRGYAPNWKACLSIKGSFTISKIELKF